MTSMEDPGPEVPPGSERLDPPAPPHPAGPASAPREGRAPRLWSRVVRLQDGLDPLSLAGEDGFVWSSPAGTLVGTGIAAKVAVGTGPGRIERAAEAVAALLAAVDIEDPGGSGLGPATVGALPFHPATTGELVVPALLLRTDPTGRSWAVLTEPGPFDPPAAADLVAGLRASAVGDHRWPPARRLDGPWPIAGSVPGGGGGGSAAGLEAWRTGVRAALEAIGTGRLDKVVLAREAAVEADWPFPRVEVLRRLRRRGGGSTFLYASGGFVGASPELLVRRRGRVAVSRQMAGT